jgi:hypothetical protein
VPQARAGDDLHEFDSVRKGVITLPVGNLKLPKLRNLISLLGFYSKVRGGCQCGGGVRILIVLAVSLVSLVVSNALVKLGIQQLSQHVFLTPSSPAS